MNITLPDNVMVDLQTLAKQNNLTPEEYVVALITRDYEANAPETDGINLGRMNRSLGATTYTRGLETREKLKISEYDHHVGSPVVVTVPDDVQLTFPLFKGLFEESIVRFGPNKFQEHYVFNASTVNLGMINRCVRLIWNRIQDQDVYRITVHFSVAGDDAEFTVWKQYRNDNLELEDEIDVGDYYSIGDALNSVKEANGILIGDIR